MSGRTQLLSCNSLYRGDFQRPRGYRTEIDPKRHHGGEKKEVKSARIQNRRSCLIFHREYLAIESDRQFSLEMVEMSSSCYSYKFTWCSREKKGVNWIPTNKQSVKNVAHFLSTLHKIYYSDYLNIYRYNVLREIYTGSP